MVTLMGCATTSTSYGPDRPSRQTFSVTVKSNNFNLNDLIVFCGGRRMTTIHNLNMTSTTTTEIDYLECNTIRFVARFLGGTLYQLNILNGPSSPNAKYCVKIESLPSLSMAIPRQC